MSDTAATAVTFRPYEGIRGPLPVSLAEFLVNYAIEKGVPIWAGSELNTLDGRSSHHTICGLEFDGSSGNSLISSSTCSVQLTVQEFLARCDAWEGAQVAAEPVLVHRRTIELGEYSNVALDGAAGIMHMNGEAITFADIRKVRALSKDTPDPSLFFRNDEGVAAIPKDETSQALITFLYDYARKHDVPLGGDIPASGLQGLGFSFNFDDRDFHGLADFSPVVPVTVQQFMKKCENHTQLIAKYDFRISRNYFAILDFTDQVVCVGCQRIPFNQLDGLCDMLTEVEVGIGSISAKS